MWESWTGLHEPWSMRHPGVSQWPLGATLTSRASHRVGLCRLVMIGSFLMPLGTLAFSLLRPDSSPVLAGVGSLVIGLRMGVLSSSSLILIKETVEAPQRGVATASNIFSRNLGSALGAAFFDAIFKFGLSCANGSTMIYEDQLHRLLQGVHQGEVAMVAEMGLRSALAGSLQLTFLVMLVVTLGIVVLAFVLPRQGLAGSTGVSSPMDTGEVIPQNLHCPWTGRSASRASSNVRPGEQLSQSHPVPVERFMGPPADHGVQR